uniref:Peroxidasin n=1 Tax=Timema monikensis TaxID=170555 RepID=A0A7R9E2L2_9NEOP|nr:unnamed protein product [Timema monikensis]
MLTGYREQLNQVTAYVDASFVYGSDVCEMGALRTSSGGQMNVTQVSGRGRPLLPEIRTHPECKSRSKVCFRGGDARASEQPGLTALHTFYLREHNRLATALAAMNPHWSDEKLYQTARRILSSVNQHYSHTPNKHSCTPSYDADCDATLVNEFAAAAFRFGHSLLRPGLARMGPDYTEKQPQVRLRDTFFNPEVLYQGNMVEELIRGLAATPMETLDEFITTEVTNHLFENTRTPYSGMDLAAINIQRGRDHGIPGYNQYRVFCNMSRAKDFDDLKKEIPSPVVERLRRLYLHVDDIDLFPGGLSETPLMGGVVGPTFACIIGHQFRLLRRCDRFWLVPVGSRYESGDPLVRFTDAQLADIRRITLSRLVCDNGEQINTIQRSLLDLTDPFLDFCFDNGVYEKVCDCLVPLVVFISVFYQFVPGIKLVLWCISSNPRVPCSSIPSLDLDLWKERLSCTVGHTLIDVGSAERISPCVMCTCTTEGPICQSLKIGNCFTLARSFSHAAVLGDHVCKVQCAFVFRALPRVIDENDNQLGFS